ncbi:Hypothetical predicted protein [Octopus vulgaris]|uniref:Uncharacterized protein n=1 Tax=Octopus vulgaris TaxID=6645 RepID=A0AA36B9G3_OCTVU|nr:Hypothetical predicted protein [Octopus vulgaris]
METAVETALMETSEESSSTTSKEDEEDDFFSITRFSESRSHSQVTEIQGAELGKYLAGGRLEGGPD